MENVYTTFEALFLTSLRLYLGFSAYDIQHTSNAPCGQC